MTVGAQRLRWLPLLSRAGWLWNALRPAYEGYLRVRYRRSGIPTVINGESLRIVPRCRSVGSWSAARGYKVYELDVWAALMDGIRPADVVADVGAHVGLFTIGSARRAVDGRVVAFEADPENAAILRRQLALNALAERIEVVEAVVGHERGTVPFAAGDWRMSSAENLHDSGSASVIQLPMVTLDAALPQGADVLKIDVEGFEGRVLEGATGLLGDAERRPRLIVLEVHLPVLTRTGWTQERLESTLQEYGYSLETIKRVEHAGYTITNLRCSL